MDTEDRNDNKIDTETSTLGKDNKLQRIKGATNIYIDERNRETSENINAQLNRCKSRARER